MKTILHLFSILALCSVLVGSIPAIKNEYRTEAYESADLFNEKRLKQHPHDVKYQPHALPRGFQKILPEQRPIIQRLPQPPQHSNFERPQIVNNIPNDYQEIIPHYRRITQPHYMWPQNTLRDDASTKRSIDINNIQMPSNMYEEPQSCNNSAPELLLNDNKKNVRPQNAFYSPHSHNEIIPGGLPNNIKVLQRKNKQIHSLQSVNNGPSERSWNSQLLPHEQQTEISERSPTAGTLVNNYPNPYADNQQNDHDNDESNQQYQTPRWLIINPVDGFETYEQGWPSQNQYHTKSVSRPMEYLQWPVLEYQKTPSENKQLSDPTIRNEYHNPEIPVNVPLAEDSLAGSLKYPQRYLKKLPDNLQNNDRVIPYEYKESETPAKEDSPASDVNPLITSLEPVHQNDHKQKDPLQQTVKNHKASHFNGHADNQKNSYSNYDQGYQQYQTPLPLIINPVDGFETHGQGWQSQTQYNTKSKRCQETPPKNTLTDSTNKPEVLTNVPLAEDSHVSPVEYLQRHVPRYQIPLPNNLQQNDSTMPNELNKSEIPVNEDKDSPAQDVDPTIASLEPVCQKPRNENNGGIGSNLYGDDKTLRAPDNKFKGITGDDVSGQTAIYSPEKPIMDKAIFKDLSTNIPSFRGYGKLREDLKIDPSELKTVTDKPVVWFRPDEQFWEKVMKGEQAYDVLTLFDVRCQPKLIERIIMTDHYPNGTDILDYVEAIWNNPSDLHPEEVSRNRVVKHSPK